MNISCVYLFERQWPRCRGDRDLAFFRSLLRSSKQGQTGSRLGPTERSQEPGSPPGLLAWLARAKALGSPSAASHRVSRKPDEKWRRDLTQHSDMSWRHSNCCTTVLSLGTRVSFHMMPQWKIPHQEALLHAQSHWKHCTSILLPKCVRVTLSINEFLESRIPSPWHQALLSLRRYKVCDF